MNMQRIEIMGPEYVVMLGMWWGAAVVLTIAFLAAKRILERRSEPRRGSGVAASGQLDG
jgi:hypothetical protein